MACGILVPWPGIKPQPPAVEVQSPNHWTAREVPRAGLWWIMYTTGLPPLLSASNTASYLQRNQVAEDTPVNFLPPAHQLDLCLSSPLPLLLYRREISSKPSPMHLLQKLFPSNSQWPWPVLIFSLFLVSSAVPSLLVGSFPWAFIYNQSFPTSE